MSFFWTAVLKDLQRLRRDPFSLIGWVATPILFAVLLNTVFSGGQAKPQGRLLIDDEDATFLSGLLASAFSREPLSEMIIVEKVKRAEGRRRMDRGDASALLIIPAGFQAAYLRNEAFRLPLLTNPSQRILPQMIQETLEMATEAGFYLQQIAGDQLRSFASSTRPDEQTIAKLSVEGSRVGESIRRYVDPPLIQLENKVAPVENKPNFTAMFFPSMLYMSMMFVANALGLDIWKEQMYGTLKRLKATPITLPRFLIARIFYVAAVALIVSTGGIAAMYAMGGLSARLVPLAIGWTTLFTVCFHMLMALVSVHASSIRGASVLANILIFPLAFIGGCFFPFEAMPAWMVRIGKLTPNGMAITQFRSILDGSATLASLAPSAAILLAMGIVVTPVLLRRMNNRFLA